MLSKEQITKLSKTIFVIVSISIGILLVIKGILLILASKG